MSKMGVPMSLLTPHATEIQAVPRSWMELLSNFSATWGTVTGPSFGIHCSRCGQDVQAGNGLTDEVLSVRCGCREYKSDRIRVV